MRVMNHSNLPNSGSLVDGVHQLPVRVYWEDTDGGGIVYHAGYVRYMERGRTEFLRALGIDQSALAMGPDAALFAVRHMQIDFLRSARLDDALTVETRPIDESGARLVFQQTIRRDVEVITSAQVTIATITLAGRPRRLPATIRNAIAALMA
jgi:acyl-CoA thioester hydrolase